MVNYEVHMTLKTPIDYKQRETETAILTNFFQRYPTEVLATLAAWYRPVLKQWASKFRSEFYRPDIPLRDYEAVAISSLADAAKNFDSTANTRFSTYLYAYARNECQRLAYNTSNNFRVFKPCKKKNREATDAIPFEKLTVQDFNTYNDITFYHRSQLLESQRRIEQFYNMLRHMSNSTSAVAKKQATRVQELAHHVLMGGTKKSFCDASGTNRGTLDEALMAIRAKLLKE